MIHKIIVTVESEPEDASNPHNPSAVLAGESVRQAVQNAVEDAEGNGFVHPFHALIALTVKSVDEAAF